MEFIKTKKGIATFENFWGEELKSVFLRHTSLRTSEITLTHIADKQIIPDALEFIYQRGIGKPSDYWDVRIETASGRKYQSTHRFSCSIYDEDAGRVILGVNGESERLYVSYPASGDCSTGMNVI
ncbi:hypothetical protein [Providencia alcalifaciens]|uniref:hypothetical protein n=1 Tax=Providencia alcalifaciens TaxID=126385 RepID=UPI002B05AAAB|nr:hypothetical protein [Providencia alcalifaciens]